MVLACQAIIHEKDLTGFYINQDYSLLELPSYNKMQVKTQLSIQEFFDLSGHHLFSYNKLEDFTNEDFVMAGVIETIANNDRTYTSITNHIRRKYDNNKHVIPLKGKEALTNNIDFTWDNNSISITSTQITH